MYTEKTNGITILEDFINEVGNLNIKPVEMHVQLLFKITELVKNDITGIKLNGADSGATLEDLNNQLSTLLEKTNQELIPRFEHVEDKNRLEIAKDITATIINLKAFVNEPFDNTSVSSILSNI